MFPSPRWELLGRRDRLLRHFARPTSKNYPYDKCAMRVSAEPAQSRHGVSTRLPEYLQVASQMMGAIQAGVKLGQTALPYLRPLVLAAAL